MNLIEFFCDGSSDNKRKKNAGWSTALFIDDKKPVIWYGHLETPSTNNQGELLGIMSSFGIAMQIQRLYGACDVNITSDSKYALDMLDPLSRSGAAKNVEYISLGFRLLNQLQGNIKTNWVKGHSDNARNDLADKFAKLGRAECDVNDPRYVTKYFSSKAHIFSHLEGIAAAKG